MFTEIFLPKQQGSDLRFARRDQPAMMQADAL